MMNVKKAVIIAAGTSSRIKTETNDRPKTLLPYSNGTILSSILENLSEAGIAEFIIVVGYKSSHILTYLHKNSNFGLNIEFCQNMQWEKGNGISVLAAEKYLSGTPFILSMSDHIVSSSAISRVIQSKSKDSLLLVDPSISEIFDIDDATKVNAKDGKILDIGKEIPIYNCIDCGIFRLDSRFFNAMRIQMQNNQESISAGIQVLIKNGDMSVVYTQDNDYWLDIDTPDAYLYAKKNLSNLL